MLGRMEKRLDGLQEDFNSTAKAASGLLNFLGFGGGGGSAGGSGGSADAKAKVSPKDAAGNGSGAAAPSSGQGEETHRGRVWTVSLPDVCLALVAL